MTNTPVPLVDLGITTRRVRDEVALRFDDVISRSAFVLGAEVEEFEMAFADYCGVAYCAGVGNGTDAIELALRGVGIGKGDDVVLPANTFVATAEAVVRAGARVVVADVGDDYLIDPASVARALTPQTRAVIGVHLYGQTAPMEQLAEVVGPDVLLVEDAAQAQGARRHGRPAGSLGTVAATSFYPGKNLGAFGDAGAVMTGSEEVVTRVRAARNHGGVRRYEHDEFGVNSRLDTLQAVVLTAKLKHLEEWNEERRAAAARYAELLGGIDGVRLPVTAQGNEPVWHLYVVQVEERDAVLAQLNAAGIGAAIHYPTPVHLLGSMRDLGHRLGDFPVAERAAGRILSLPLYPGITAAQQDRVAGVLSAAVTRR